MGPKIFNANFFWQRKLGTFAVIMNINLHRSGEQAGTQLTSIFLKRKNPSKTRPEVQAKQPGPHLGSKKPYLPSNWNLKAGVRRAGSCLTTTKYIMWSFEMSRQTFHFRYLKWRNPIWLAFFLDLFVRELSHPQKSPEKKVQDSSILDTWIFLWKCLAMDPSVSFRKTAQQKPHLCKSGSPKRPAFFNRLVF